MSKYIDADEFLRKIQEHHYLLSSFDNSKDFGLFDCGIKQIVDEMPAADVVEVVRCKDCKHFADNGSCLLLQGLTFPTPNDYCAYLCRTEEK